MLRQRSLQRQSGNGQSVLSTSLVAFDSPTCCAKQQARRPPLSRASPAPLASAKVTPLCPKRPIRQCSCRAAAGSNSSSSSTSDRLQKVLDGIDALNNQDPRTIEVNGQQVPYELAYSQWLTDWVVKLTQDEGAPPLSDELRIIARGQHVQRWTSPRSSYPEGKAAYFKWREDLKAMHANVVVGLMEAAGYPAESCETVRRIILKKNIKEANNSVVEDALVLVFLQYQFAEFRLKETDERMVEILRKSWKKLSPRGQAAALKLPLGEKEAALVGQALAAKPAAQ